jgi:hypothetical protein
MSIKEFIIVDKDINIREEELKDEDIINIIKHNESEKK